MLAKLGQLIEKKHPSVSEAYLARSRPLAAAHQARRLKDYLKAELERTGLRPKAPDLALRVQRNPPAVVDETADIELAGREIVRGASFDNNLICIDEKTAIAVRVAEAD